MQPDPVAVSTGGEPFGVILLVIDGLTNAETQVKG